jgi:hypothetical protein
MATETTLSDSAWTEVYDNTGSSAVRVEVQVKSPGNFKVVFARASSAPASLSSVGFSLYDDKREPIWIPASTKLYMRSLPSQGAVTVTHEVAS